MNSRIAKFLLPSIAALGLSHEALAEKVVGTCKVDVVGAHPFTINGKLYEGTTPENAVPSVGTTKAWALKSAEEYRKVSSTLADQKAHMADTLMFAFGIQCASDKGRLQLQPYNGTAKVADYPSGPKNYRLVGDNMRDTKSGDVSAFLLSPEFSSGMIEPAEAGELKVTQNDGDKLVATFSFKSKTYSVTGSVDFTRPKEAVK